MNQILLSLWAAPAAIGFAASFSVHRRALPLVAALAFLAHLLRSAFEGIGWSLVGASLVAAFASGAVAHYLGRATGEAPSVYAFAPVIPLVPGTLLFDGFDAFGQLVSGQATEQEAMQLIAAAGQDLLTAGAVVLALAIGSTAPSLLLRRAPH